ncbi:head-tail adaptor protein [Adlercreutzia sp. ZJ138]|uniref:phage head completion protein n=1 Tax=Adlercreutzia sp. ZJ138 TaxID=2709405 RepID=UPI0013EA15C5|nr:head-tail adaptor protein [Adlercreutzia sp. ZJ138]
MIHGETVFVDGTEPVLDVVVQVGETSSQQSNLDEHQGAIADYTLHFPMTYENDLTGRRVLVRGIECDVIGHPDHQRPEQVFGRRWRGKWDMPVRVRRIIGTPAEHARVYAKTVRRDHTGRRTEETVTLYEGILQARKSSGAEADGEGGTNSLTGYVFVMDWLDALDDYQTQELFVDYDGKTYDITSVENKDEKNETAILRGEWRG